MAGMKKKILQSLFKKVDPVDISSKILPYHFSALGGAAMTAGALAVVGNSELLKAGNANKIGKTTIAENLDRLVSYDGSGFAQNMNRVSRGNPEIMKDMVKNTFDNYNQWGADGNIVFALHNLREG